MKTIAIIMFILAGIAFFLSFEGSSALSSNLMERSVSLTIIDTPSGDVEEEGFDSNIRGLIDTGSEYKTIGTLTNNHNERVIVKLEISADIVDYVSNNGKNVKKSSMSFKADSGPVKLTSSINTVEIEIELEVGEVEEIRLRYVNLGEEETYVSYVMTVYDEFGVELYIKEDSLNTPFNSLVK